MATSPKVTVFHRRSDRDIHSYVVGGAEDGVVHRLNEERRAILAEVDNARFSWFHIKVAFVSGAGFFTDAYDIFAINVVTVMLGYVYGDEQDASVPGVAGRSLSAKQQLGVKVATPIGIIVGQLLFGWLGDVMGRKRIYGLELMIMIIGTFGQTIAAPSMAVSFIALLIVWRTFMGIGIGGDYPLSAVISSEFSSTHIRGRVMTAVFANQGWGQLAATAVSCVVVRAYKSSLISNGGMLLEDIDRIWRIIIGLGCVPAVIALYFRLTIPETPRFTLDIQRNVERAARDIDEFLTHEGYTVDLEAVSRRLSAQRATKEDFRRYFGRWENLKVLIGTSYSWFALDFAFYGLGLNSSVIMQAIGLSLFNTSLGNLVLSLAGFVPGYWVAFLFIDRWGRKPIQLMGFCALTVLLVVMAHLDDARDRVFVFLYCLANFFQNFGPNTTTFIVPGEAFPTRYRSTAHGISAASGKFGAVLAQVAFQWLKDIGGARGSNAFLDHILQIFGFFMLTGVLSTMLIPETNQKTLEALSNERQDKFFRFLDPRRRSSVKTFASDFPLTAIKLKPFQQTHEPELDLEPPDICVDPAASPRRPIFAHVNQEHERFVSSPYPTSPSSSSFKY
ncbi:phosphate transporter [Fomitopsis serialis]|uniref:phosphate transporter n=1 Tax=Fomitopsis serialis TaxID=139415 RepID=UPI002007DCCA|nr:phosphate transporter [Neoantrodia serialis]KAH9928735.1 phosphate transporter [Neoantrodia serialis]